MTRRGLQLVLALAVAVLCASAGARAAGLELIANGGAETVSGEGKPVGWSAEFLREGEGEQVVDAHVFHSGTHSLKIEGAPGNRGHCCWRSAYVPIRVAEETEAELSLWIRAEDSPWLMVRVVVRDARGEFHQYLTPFSVELGGFFDWTEFRKTIRLKPGGARLSIYLVQPRSGKAWFDDVSLIAGKDVRRDAAAASLPGSSASTPSAEKTPAPRAAARDLFEFRNYIRNTRMAPPVGLDGLPYGWSVHNPPEEETVGRVRWAKGDPRPGYYSICVEWLEGGRYLATQPELTQRVTGERPLTFRAYVKTVGGGRGHLVAQSVDNAGKLMRQAKSNVVENASDYDTCRIDFVTHPDTADLRLYCVNGGTGKAWFHWAILEPNLAVAKDMAVFPYTVSAEPAEGNRFWNHGRAVVHSFEDSPVSVSFAFWGDKSRLDTPRLIVEAPAGLMVPEAFNMEPRPPVSHAKAEFTTERVVRDGVQHLRYVFPGPAALQRMRVTPYLYNHLTTCFVPRDGVREHTFAVYYHAENGGVQSVEKSFELRVLPPMKRTPNPKRFISHLWTVDDINFHDMDLVGKAARRFEEAALAGRERWTGGREEIHRVDQFLKKRGWFLFYETGPAAYAFRKSDVRIVGGDGKPGTHSYGYCPTNAVLDTEFYENTVLPHVRKTLEEQRVEDGEWIFVDYEPGSIATKYCFCDRCREVFARKFGLPPSTTGTRRDVLTSHARAWGQYWVWLCDEILRLHRESFRRANPTLKHLEYCYAIWFDNPEATQTKLFNSPLDTRLNQNHMDRLGLSFYHLLGKTAFDMLDVNVRVLEKPCLTMPLMGTTTPYWGNFTDDQILTPEGMRQQILIAASTGAAGVMPYQGKLMDGMYFLRIDQAMAEIAALERFYMDGTRSDGIASLAPAPSKPLPAVDKTWRDCVGIRAHELNGDVLLTIFNFRRQGSAEVIVKLEGMEPGDRRVLDPVAGKPARMLGGERPPSPTRTGSELRRGLRCAVAAEDVRFLLLERQ